ncbi:MAG: nucleotidyltransferase family protein, partial [Candidatus Heimdallarchaeaceae archaeon]
MTISKSKNNNKIAVFLDLLKKHRKEIEKQFNVNYLGIFGSYVRDEQKELSDIDILVEFSETPSLFQFIKLENYLSELLEIKVDLVMKSALKPNIGKQI